MLGALGAALGTMVANISAHKRGWDDRWEEFSGWAERGLRRHDELLRLVDADTEAFNGIIAAMGLPKDSDNERDARQAAIESATKKAIDVPLAVMRMVLEAMEVIGEMSRIGNPNSASDAGVGALCARSAALGAFLNVRTNCAGLSDKAFVDKALTEGRTIAEKVSGLESEILRVVEGKIGG